MPRQLPRELAGAIYHVLNRGDRQEAIFRSALEFQPVERGWCLGGEDVRRELLARAEGRQRAIHYGAERREAQEDKALRLLQEEWRQRGWDPAALRQAGKGDARKVRLAARLRKETTMSLRWIAQHLAIGSRTHVSNLLGARRNQESLKSVNGYLYWTTKEESIKSLQDIARDLMKQSGKLK